MIGVCGGGVTAWWTQDEVRVVDPLGLGVPMENVGCTGETLVIVGSGGSRTSLVPAARDWDEDGVKYLETDRSCDTIYSRGGDKTPTYVAYLAFPTAEAACKERMTLAHKNDLVTRMRLRNTDRVMCPCELDRTALPEIGEDREITDESRMWTAMYQQMLEKLGRLDIDRDDLGDFNRATEEATRLLRNGSNMEPWGYVDQETWTVVRDRSCRLFDN